MPASASSSSPARPTRSRILNACERCRKKKIRCSGIAPCRTCTENQERCIFGKAEKKVMVSESYLRTLIANAESGDHDSRHNETPPRQEPITPSASENATSLHETTPQSTAGFIEESVPALRNSLTSSEAFFYIDSSYRQRYLGSSSSLSFSWQVRSFLQNYVGSHVPINLIPVSEEETYTVASASVRNSTVLPSTANELPPKEYAKYLAETTFFHLSDVFHVADRASFMAQVDGFYTVEWASKPLQTLWQAQFLLVIAFGQLFLRRGASTLGPPGAKEFLWALRVQSDLLDVWGDPTLHVEVLCLTALYLNCADMRASAYTYIGLAMRIALSLGMNREPPRDLLDEAEFRRRRRAWWTLYIIDRKLTLIVGAPLSIRDEDIDISMPDPDEFGTSNAGLIMHIRLANLEGQVKQTAYSIDSTVDKTFVHGLQQIFAYMGNLAKDFTGLLSLSLQNPKRVSRTAATLHIMYHQCTIISTRPLLFALIKHRMTVSSTHQTVSIAVSTLLKTCIGAATQIISILSALHQQDLVEAFLPMDLQAAFSAGFILIVTMIAYPSVMIDSMYIDTADDILSWMSAQGNSPAKSRRRDLAELRAAAQTINLTRTENTTNMVNTSPQLDLTSTWTWGLLPNQDINNEMLFGPPTSATTEFDSNTDATWWNQIIDELTRS